MFVHTHTHGHMHTPACTCTYLYICVHMYIHRYTYTYTCAYIYVLVHRHIYTCVHIHACTYIYADIQIDTCARHCASSLVANSCLFVTPWTAAHQVSLSFTVSRSLLKLVSIESVMIYN